ncbi:MAG: LON peptidase substrate-binding domain-containing protein [Rhodospirillales bacterium]|jgi:Lon protease-like protein|nr:LON peptidase substrate-binding domain-containing protein [Rhodospirillales bacterium]
MTAGIPDTGGPSLPETLPVFPLGGALLLPRAKLPLNIFEPRYLNMLEDALAGPRTIGMIQPRAAVDHPVPDDALLYGIGCAGRITSFSETADGRYLITLTGISRFAVVREVEMTRGYRRVAADYRPFAGDLGEETGKVAGRDRLLKTVRAFFAKSGMEADWPALEAVPDDALVSALAMVSPLEPTEKQALLECPGLAERGEFLLNLLEIMARAGDEETSKLRH